MIRKTSIQPSDYLITKTINREQREQIIRGAFETPLFSIPLALVAA